MRCEIVKDFSRLQQLSPIWRKWVRQSSEYNVFQTWEWAQAYWTAYSHKLSLWSPVVYLDQEPIAILPLARRDRQIEFLSSPWSDYNDILCDGHGQAAALETALAEMLNEGGWDGCLFDCLLSTSNIVRHLNALPVRIRNRLQLVSRSPAPTIMLGEDKPELLKKLANKSQLKRYYNQLSRLGRVSFRHLETQEEAREHLESFFHQHITRWAVAGKRSEFLDPDQRRFYRALVETLDPNKELRFGVLESNGEPLAYHFGFQKDGKLTWYKPAFNVNHWNQAPGDVLLRCLFQYAEEADLREFDFSLGDEPYKHHYSNHVKQTYMLYFDRHPGRVVSQVRRAERAARGLLRREPRLKFQVGRCLAALARICSRRRLADWIEAARAVFGRLIWKRTEAALYRHEYAPSNRSPITGVTGKTLDYLAELSIAFPELIGHSRLLECKKRLRAGDRVLVVKCRAEEMPVIVWLGKRSELAIPGIGEQGKISLGVEAMIIYEIWTGGRNSHGPVPAEVLRIVLDEVSGPELWIAASDRALVTQRALEDTGFRLKTRVSHTALFHWLRRTQVLDSAEFAVASLEISNERV
jgi:CelD/BcsL family acetyltransferase involved in cellulose biosynthesis